MPDARSDAALLEAWQTGDQRAGAELFARHFEAVARFFRNKADGAIDDLVQKTFLGCVEGRLRVRGEAGFRGYLFGVARNVLRKHWRVRATHGPSDTLDEASLVELGASPSSAYARDRSQLTLLNALRRIPLDGQVILELCYWEQLTSAEIAAVLQIPVGTAKTRIRRARALLAQQLMALETRKVPLRTTRTRLQTWARGVRGAG